MIEDYNYNGCPVIEIKDFERAKLSLPSRKEVNNKTKSDTFTVFLDGDEEKFVMFDWDERANRWKLRNRIVVEVKINPAYFCKVCSQTNKCIENNIMITGLPKITEHIVNLQVTKKKCRICNTVSDI